jgi:hypothetical protein
VSTDKAPVVAGAAGQQLGDVECSADDGEVTVYQALRQRISGRSVGQKERHAIVDELRRALAYEALLATITALADLELLLEGRMALHGTRSAARACQ